MLHNRKCLQSCGLLWLFGIFVSDEGQGEEKRIQFLARVNLFLIVDWETLYRCGKFLSDSKPLEFQTVASGLETHKVNLDFCGIKENKCFFK